MNHQSFTPVPGITGWIHNPCRYPFCDHTLLELKPWLQIWEGQWQAVTTCTVRTVGVQILSRDVHMLVYQCELPRGRVPPYARNILVHCVRSSYARQHTRCEPDWKYMKNGNDKWILLGRHMTCSFAQLVAWQHWKMFNKFLDKQNKTKLGETFDLFIPFSLFFFFVKTYIFSRSQNLTFGDLVLRNTKVATRDETETRKHAKRHLPIP